MLKRTATASAGGIAALVSSVLWTAGAGGQTAAPAAPAAAPASYAIAWGQLVDVPGDPRIAVGNAAVFLSSTQAGLAAYSPDDGRKLWATALLSDLPPVVSNGVVGMLSGDTLHVLDQRTGRPLWRASIDPAGTQFSLHAVGNLLLVASGQELIAWSIDGAEVWRRDLGSAPVTPIAWHAGTLFVGIDAPALAAIDEATGAVRWRIGLPTRPSSLIAISDRLYLSGADGALYSYRQTGARKPAWRYPLLEAIGQPAADERHVYFTLIDNTLRAFERKRGSQRWSRELPSRPAAGPLLAGADVVAPTTTGRLVQFSARAGILPAGERSPPTPTVRLQAVAATTGGESIFTVVAASDDTRTLAMWRRPAPKKG